MHGLKNTDLVQLCRKSRVKLSGNNPELIGRVLEKWRNYSSASTGEESTGAVASLGKAQAILEQAKHWTKL